MDGQGSPGEVEGVKGMLREQSQVKNLEKLIFCILYVILPRIGLTKLLQMISEMWDKENAM